MTIRAADHDFGLDPASLVQYAVTAKVDLILGRRWSRNRGWVQLDPPGRRKDLAKASGISEGELTTRIKRSWSRQGSDGTGESLLARKRAGWRKRLMRSPLSAVSDLEEDLAMFAIRDRGVPVEALEASGSLVAFWQELLGTGETANQSDLRAGRWLGGLAKGGLRSTAEVLVAGEALMALLAHADDARDARLLIERHRDAVTTTARALVTVASRPPGKGSAPAIHLAAQLGCLPVQWEADRSMTVCDLVLEHVRESPVGFRTTRILSHLITLSGPSTSRAPRWWSVDRADERRAAWNALLAIDELDGDRDPYPARSLWVEGLRAARLSKDPALGHDAARRLHERSLDGSRPPRERAYAAYCAHRARRDHPIDVHKIVEIFDASGDDGLRHAARTLEVLEAVTGIGSSLETLLLEHHDADEPVVQRFQDTPAVVIVDTLLGFLDQRAPATRPPIDPHRRVRIANMLAALPESIRSATTQLLRYALLSIDGSARRRAADTLREGGLGQVAGAILLEFADEREAPRFLREHAAFLSGFLNEPYVITDLAFLATDRDIDESIRHAALWSIGDIAAPDQSILAVLIRILDDRRGEPVGIVRASTYALATLFPEPDDTTEVRTSDLLRELAKDADPLVGDLARWGLLNRSRAMSRQQHRGDDEIWGIAPDLRATLDSALLSTYRGRTGVRSSWR